MGDKQESPAETKKGFGWLKAVGGGVGGLLSGRVVAGQHGGTAAGGRCG